jgi:hypothetical protein
MGEEPSRLTLIGAAIVLGAVLANEVFGAWRGGRLRRAERTTPVVLPPA